MDINQEKIFKKSQQILEELENKSESRSIYSNDLPTYPNNKDDKLEFLSFKDLRNTGFPPNKWIVKGLIPENGITCISGQPKIGKSFLNLDLAICLATGRKFLGEFEVEKSGVLFITKEDPKRLINERIIALTNDEDLSIIFCPDNKLFFDNSNYIDEVLKVVKDNNLKVIIIDSFRRIFKGDENSSQIISEVHNRLKLLTNEGLTAIFIHHHGKEGFFKRANTDKLRGSSDILAMLDSLLIVEKKDESTLKITHGALRVDKPLQPFVVKFPTFQNGDNSFQFAGHIEEEKEKKELAKEDILAFLQNGEANQKTIIEALKEKKHAATTIKDAIKELNENKKVVVRPEGIKKFYSLPTSLLQEENPFEEVVYEKN